MISDKKQSMKELTHEYSEYFCIITVFATVQTLTHQLLYSRIKLQAPRNP